VKLQRIADQVLQQLAHLQRVGLKRGEFSDLHLPAALLDTRFQIAHHLARHIGKIDQSKRLRYWVFMRCRLNIAANSSSKRYWLF